ncbi:MAG TPA: GFA family protein [Myxococcota bacterium]|jgi:hypothetical protein|nr:GFA family protein [Myxococcota bacterium]
MTDLSGGCLCGELRYRITAAPESAGYCHCRLCQRSSGAPVLAWASVPAAGFAWERGAPREHRSSERGIREFCAHCGTQIRFRRPGAPRLVDVNLGSLDDPAAVRPEYHIWTSSRVPWLALEDGLPRYDGDGPDLD